MTPTPLQSLLSLSLLFEVMLAIDSQCNDGIQRDGRLFNGQPTEPRHAQHTQPVN